MRTCNHTYDVSLQAAYSHERHNIMLRGLHTQAALLRLRQGMPAVLEGCGARSQILNDVLQCRPELLYCDQVFGS